MSKTTRKPKRCQWVEGVVSKQFSGLATCHSKPMFEVYRLGTGLGWVCAKHAVQIVQHGYQIR